MVLTIYNLQQVCEKLESASPKWFGLGLALGLSHPDLTNIKDQNGDNQICLREMLAKLLGTQRVLEFAESLQHTSKSVERYAFLIWILCTHCGLFY